MCGLTGFWDPSSTTGGDALEATVLRMADTLVHRGPDDRGAWVDPEMGLALGFRRLSIIDLSPEGHQPMRSTSGRYVLAFNGEIYNCAELRRELTATPFRGHSDTEVMLAAFERWGIEPAVRRFVGMFGFALWDRAERTLTLGRDRLGEKPLYYGWADDVFLFGSELKSIRAHPRFRDEIDQDAVGLYLAAGYIPAPYSIHRGIHKLEPGSLLSLKEPTPGTMGELRAYWAAEDVASAGLADPFDGTEVEAIDHLEGLLHESIRQQMVADVPLGAFLSGGIDSSTVVAMMQRLGSRPTRTFTIGFREAGFDEARHAREVARHLGTDHTELYVTPDESREVIPELPGLFDEPFADSSSIPVFLVSRLARREVTVCLSGDGGDELFAGYPWYPRTRRLWDRLRRIPPMTRRVAAGGLAQLADRWPTGGETTVLGSGRLRVTGDRLRTLARIIRETDGPESLHHALMTRWGEGSPILRGADRSRMPRGGGKSRPGLSDIVGRLMLADLTTYLPDDILVKVDRAAMGNSLETRAPLLDHRVVEFAWKVPLAYKLRDGRGKWLLRRVLDRYVPSELIDRPKMGFSVPISDWIRGPLRDWTESLLSEEALARDGMLEPGPVRRRWADHLAGRSDRGTELWHVLMLMAWRSHHRTGSSFEGGTTRCE